MSGLQEAAKAIWWAGVRAVSPDQLIGQHVHRQLGGMSIGSETIDCAGAARIVVLGAGKAGGGMAVGLERAILNAGFPVDRLSGWVNVPEDTSTPLTKCVQLHLARPMGSNEPTVAAVDGANEILRLASTAGKDDLCVVLLSGGGSALLPAPLDGISLADKLAVTRLLSCAGADIVSLNKVRKRLSRIKGGGLARACTANRMVVFVLSDVLGDSLQSIASGPCIADESSQDDALAILERFDPNHILPAAVYRFLKTQNQSDSSGSIHCKVTHQIIGNLSLAVDVAGEHADHLGWKPAMVVARQSEGSAEKIGRHLARMAVEMLRQESPNCLISGGEPTVTLPPAEICGRGGRNQQLVLAAWQELLSNKLTGADLSRICILSGGTDGEDGPTDAAGGVVGPEQLLNPGLSASMIADHLVRCDAYPLLERCNALFRTRATGTNVCDMRVVLVQPKT